jgi:HEAT repeat protein
VWWGDAELLRDIDRRSAEDAARIGEWLAISGSHDVLQDERMEHLREHARESFSARLRLLRIAARRKRGSSVALLRKFLNDPDERLVRMAAREIVRRRPADFENMLLQLMTSAPQSVRRVISRSVGQAGFEHFWDKFDRLNRPTRKRAGQAMLKILPDAIQRLQRRLAAGPQEQKLKAMQMAQELGLAEPLKDQLLALCADTNPKLRSKAVSVAGAVKSVGAELLVDKLVNDVDPRVRANTIEVLESRSDRQFIPLLTQRARSGINNRERANAIKALHGLKVGTVNGALADMLRDGSSEHRISALWTLKKIGWWQLLNEVGRLAKSDDNLRVRRYALAVLKGVAEMAQAARNAKMAGVAA